MSLNLRTTWQGQNVQPFIKEQVVINRLVNLKASKKQQIIIMKTNNTNRMLLKVSRDYHLSFIYQL